VATTPVLHLDRDAPDPAILEQAAAILRAGGLVAFPTETVYGLGADATNPEAVARIFLAKGRPASNPLIVHVESLEAARRCVADWPDRAETLANRYWPGPLTLVLPRSAIIPDVVTAGQGTVGVRVPRPLVARELIRRTGRPIAAPSANRSTGVSPTMARHVLKDLDGRVDLILDADPSEVGIESTVLDLTEAVPRILRPGGIRLEELSQTLGEPVLGPAQGGTAPHRSPGQMAVHYAPRIPAYRVEPGGDFPPGGEIGRGMILRLGSKFPADEPGTNHRQIELHRPEEAARELYRLMHGAEDEGLAFVAILMPPDEPEWAAVRDRIVRATTPWVES
jgi:L-threonylcarbamoyladenylate synthase